MRVPPDYEKHDHEYYLARRLIEAHRKVAFFASISAINGVIVIVLAIILWWKL